MPVTDPQAWATLVCLGVVVFCLYKGVRAGYEEYSAAKEEGDTWSAEYKEALMWLIGGSVFAFGFFAVFSPGEVAEDTEATGIAKIHEQAPAEPTKQEREAAEEEKVHPMLKEVRKPVDSEKMFNDALKRAEENNK